MANELSSRYQQILYDVLQVNPQPDLTLPQLRLYASSFFSETSYLTWSCPDLPVEFNVGMGPLVYAPDNYHNHVANVLDFLRPIALERGDIFENRQWRVEPRYIPFPLTDEQQRAMGLIPNPFGVGTNFIPFPLSDGSA